MARINVTVKKMEPIITCAPWNPVATNRADPIAESVRSKEVSMYSSHCKTVNITPRVTPNAIPIIIPVFEFLIIASWAHVILTPLTNKIPVLRSGIENGFKYSIPTLGHIIPMVCDGINPT